VSGWVARQRPAKPNSYKCTQLQNPSAPPRLSRRTHIPLGKCNAALCIDQAHAPRFYVHRAPTADDHRGPLCPSTRGRAPPRPKPKIHLLLHFYTLSLPHMTTQTQTLETPYIYKPHHAKKHPLATYPALMFPLEAARSRTLPSDHLVRSVVIFPLQTLPLLCRPFVIPRARLPGQPHRTHRTRPHRTPTTHHTMAAAPIRSARLDLPFLGGRADCLLPKQREMREKRLVARLLRSFCIRERKLPADYYYCPGVPGVPAAHTRARARAVSPFSLSPACCLLGENVSFPLKPQASATKPCRRPGGARRFPSLQKSSVFPWCSPVSDILRVYSILPLERAAALLQ
jgi:hypothetical protein